jgi:hypothetical protein
MCNYYLGKDISLICNMPDFCHSRDRTKRDGFQCRFVIVELLRRGRSAKVEGSNIKK